MKASYLKRYPLTHFLTAVILVLSLAPIPEVPQLEGLTLADKWAHIIMYFGFSVTIWWEYLHQHRQRSWKRLLVGATLAPAVMSGLLELAQEYLTNCRSGEWLDLLANCVGVSLGALVGTMLSKVCKGSPASDRCSNGGRP